MPPTDHPLAGDAWPHPTTAERAREALRQLAHQTAGDDPEQVAYIHLAEALIKRLEGDPDSTDLRLAGHLHSVCALMGFPRTAFAIREDLEAIALRLDLDGDDNAQAYRAFARRIGQAGE